MSYLDEKKQVELERVILRYFTDHPFKLKVMLQYLAKVPAHGVSEQNTESWKSLMDDTRQPGTPFHSYVASNIEQRAYLDDHYKVPSTFSIQDIISELRSCIRSRLLVVAVNDALSKDKDPDKAIEHAREALENFNQEESSSDWVSLAEIQSSDLFCESSPVTPTCLEGLDYILEGGFALGDLAVIGGRPGDGKTALAGSICVARAEQGLQTGFVGWEMSNKRQAWRMASIALRVNGQDVKRNPGKYCGVALETTKKIHLLEDNTSNPMHTIRQIKRHHRANPKCDLYFVDYIQYASDLDKRGGRADFLEQTVFRFQQLAKDLDVSVCILSQISRDGDSANLAKDRPPSLVHLKGSGGIEQAGNTILLIWDRYGTIETADHERDKAVIVAKAREASTGIINLAWRPYCTRFEGLPIGHLGVSGDW